MNHSTIAVDKAHLRELVLDAIATYGPQCNLNHIDVSRVEDFSKLFALSPFDGDISQWNTENATSFREMFMGSSFNGDVSKWNTANVLDTTQMFRSSAFAGNVEHWDVGQVYKANSMFRDCPFEGDLSKWTFSPYLQPAYLSDFVAHETPGPRPKLLLPPNLPTRCLRLFTSPQAMFVWLEQQPMGRYHWDALLVMGPSTQDLAPWATVEMLDTVRSYLALCPDARLHPTPAHANALMQAWESRGQVNECLTPSGGFEISP